MRLKITQALGRIISPGSKHRFASLTGFTLLEIMVAVAILAFGIVSIYEALFASLDAFSYYSNYLNIQTWANEKIWDMEDHILRSEIPERDPAAGTLKTKSKTFNWQTQVIPLDSARGLYNLNLTLSWKEGRREINIFRSTYAMTAPEITVLAP